MLRCCCLLLLAALSFGCSGQSHATRFDAQAFPDAEEYAVYSALLRDVYVKDQVRLLVIRDHTSTGRSVPDSEADLRQTLEYAQKHLPPVPPEAVDNFIANNAQSHPLLRSINLEVDTVLVNKEEVETIFRQGRGWWENFERKYPSSRGIITLSRVGFDPGRGRALVYTDLICGYALPCGNGYYVLLSRKEGGWVVEGKMMPWIS